MDDTRAILERAGVPSGTLRRRNAVLDDRLKQELASLAAHPERMDPLLEQALFAWLRALEHHWPSSFDAVAGPSGRALLERLGRAERDANRHVKLRRIAIDNLAGRL